MDTIESSLEKIHINITYSNILPLIIYICRDEGPRYRYWAVGSA